MLRKIFIIQSLILSSVIHLHGQTAVGAGDVMNVENGNAVSDIQLHGLANYNSEVLNISDYHGMPVIIDMWNSGCAGCILSWPKLLELQTQFIGKVKIILANPWASKESVVKVFARRQRVAGVNMVLPCSCGDTAFLRMFPVSSVPCILWIDKNGVVRYRTNSEYLTDGNIKVFLEGGSPRVNDFVNSRDRKHLDLRDPYFLEKTSSDVHNLMWKSTLTRGNDSLWSGEYLRILNHRGIVYCIGSSLFRLYRLAYSNRLDREGDLSTLISGRLMLDLSKKERSLLSSTFGDVDLASFDYSLNTPSVSLSTIQNEMQGDLERYFHLQAKWGIVRARCLVLTADDTSIIRYKGGPSGQIVDIDTIDINNYSVSDFIKNLEDVSATYDSIPIINEIVMGSNLGHISFSCDINNYVAVDQMLRKYKMHLELKYRRIRKLIITDRKSNNKGTTDHVVSSPSGH